MFYLIGMCLFFVDQNLSTINLANSDDQDELSHKVAFQPDLHRWLEQSLTTEISYLEIIRVILPPQYNGPS